MSTTTERPTSQRVVATRPVAATIGPASGERAIKARTKLRTGAPKRIFLSASNLFDYLNDSTVMERHVLVSHGLPKKALEDAIAWFDKIPKQAVLDAIGISQKTVDRKATDEVLNPQHSNALFSLLEVSRLADSTLGNKHLAEQWLNTPAIGLDGAKPISLLGTGPGVEAVKDLLARIEYGVYA